MSARNLLLMVGLALAGSFFSGCATTKPFDYTNFRQNRPRSILVLPPLNNSTDVRGTYGYLSTVSRPLAELGYYVFPVAIVDQFLKDNGLPGPGEMHQVPLDKLAKIFGTDAVMYITLDEYGTKYRLLSSFVIVRASAKLVDAKTGLLLWEGHAEAEQGSNNSGGGLIGALVQAAVSQAINSSVDSAHQVSKAANSLLFTRGPALLYGPYRPEGEIAQ